LLGRAANNPRRRDHFTGIAVRVQMPCEPVSARARLVDHQRVFGAGNPLATPCTARPTPAPRFR
jgi:hypothetical protein